MAGKEDNLSEKLGRFWRVLFLTEDGRPKSSVLLYSFLLSLVFLAIHVAAYAFLVGPIQKIFVPDFERMTLKEFSEFALANKTLVFWMNVLESVLPGLAGAVVCCGISLLIKERAIPAGAYIWLVVLLVIVLIAMIPIARDAQVYRSFLFFVLMYVPVGLLTGTIFTHHRYGAYRRAKKRKALELEEAKRKEAEL